VAFDLTWFHGPDLRPLPLTERRRRLQHILPKGSAIISEVPSVIGTGHKLFDLMCVNDLEGIVAKRLTDPYRASVRWLKIKNPGYSQNEGRRELFDKSPQNTHPPGRISPPINYNDVLIGSRPGHPALRWHGFAQLATGSLLETYAPRGKPSPQGANCSTGLGR